MFRSGSCISNNHLEFFFTFFPCSLLILGLGKSITVDHQKRKDPCCLVSGFALVRHHSGYPSGAHANHRFGSILFPFLLNLFLRWRWDGQPLLVLPTFVVRLLSLTGGAAFFQSEWWIHDSLYALFTAVAIGSRTFFSMTVVKSQSPGLSGESVTSMVSEYNISKVSILC